MAKIFMNPHPIPDEFQRELDWVRQIGKADAETQYSLAMQLKEGVGRLPKNVEAARYILAEAALKKLPKARFAYGQSLITGELGERRPRSGLWNIYMAADRGYAPAQKDLGLRHIRGDLVVKSRVHAYLWLREAMKNGADVADTLAAVESAMTKDEISYARAIKTPRYRPDRDQLK